jgi:glucose/mannose transport system substrate-binding protein
MSAPPRPRRARRLPLGAALLAALAAAPACGRSPSLVARALGTEADPGAPPAPEHAVEMFSWWERMGDLDPLGALIQVHRAHHPEDVIINASNGLSGLARRTLRARMMRNEPPDTFQANAGSDFMQWVLVNGMDAHESKLLPLDDLIDNSADWRRAVPRAVLDQVSYDGEVYGVPADVHRVNTLFYNRKVFQKYGLSEPKTVDDLRAIAARLRGTGISPLAIGTREPWTAALVIFECLLVAREGPDVFQDYFRGALHASDPRIVRALQEGLRLFDLANPDHARLSWLQGVELVVRGQAAMTVMGDWARMIFKAYGLKMDQDWGEMAFPGTADTFIFTSDAFSLPVEAKNQAGARRLLATVGSIEGQRAISAAKGALPARLDVAPPADDRLLQEKHALLKSGHLVLALSGTLPRTFSEDLDGALAEMLAAHDIEPVVHTLRSRYALLNELRSRASSW